MHHLAQLAQPANTTPDAAGVALRPLLVTMSVVPAGLAKVVVAAAITLAQAKIVAMVSPMVTSSLTLVDLLTPALKVLMTMAQNV